MMRYRKSNNKKIKEPTYNSYEGQEALHFLGELRLMRFLRFLQPDHNMADHFLQKIEQGESLETLFAPLCGYSLTVQDTQTKNCFVIYFGTYTPGFNIGGVSFLYVVDFDETDNVKNVKFGGVLQS